MNRLSYDSYKIDIESIDPSKDFLMRKVYELDPARAKWLNNKTNGVALLVRTGGSRHTGQAAPPHRNIQQEKAWRDKAEKFKNHSIMETNFSEIADRFQQIIQKMRKEGPAP